MPMICKFVSIATWEITTDIRDHTPLDLIGIPTVWLASSVDTAQKMAEFELESEGQWMDDDKPPNMGWEPPNMASPECKAWQFHYVDLDVKGERERLYAILVVEEAQVHDTPPIEPASSFGG